MGDRVGAGEEDVIPVGWLVGMHACAGTDRHRM